MFDAAALQDNPAPSSFLRFCSLKAALLCFVARLARGGTDAMRPFAPLSLTARRWQF
jgi:hypothetical protein